MRPPSAACQPAVGNGGDKSARVAPREVISRPDPTMGSLRGHPGCLPETHEKTGLLPCQKAAEGNQRKTEHQHGGRDEQPA